MSSSRGSGCSVICLASPIKRLVSPDMADGTTTILCPASCHLATRAATFLIRSVEPIDVPPYLWTIKAITVRFPACEGSEKTLTLACCSAKQQTERPKKPCENL